MGRSPASAVRTQVVLKCLGWLMFLLAALDLLPAVVALGCGESELALRFLDRGADTGVGFGMVILSLALLMGHERTARRLPGRASEGEGVAVGTRAAELLFPDCLLICTGLSQAQVRVFI